MSAFFVGTDHINAMLSFIEHHRCSHVPFPIAGNETFVDATEKNLTAIGRALMAENIASLRYRYPNDWQGMVDVDVNEYRYEHDCHFISYTRNIALVVIKMVSCYEYQSCEHPGWPASWAHGFCIWLTHYAVTRLDGFENAPGWEYTRPKGAPTMIRLSDLMK